VSVERLAYRRRGEENLHLADALLNLPQEKHSGSSLDRVDRSPGS
jgi:hypothetical protein